MFGYVLPLREELKVKDWEWFRSVYCGLCHTLGRRCGVLSRLMLSYDFTFLALLLGTGRAQQRRRCISGPCHGRQACCSCDALEVAADETVILTWWKLRDQIQDGDWSKRLAARSLSLLYRPAYQKAAAGQPVFARCVQEELTRLDVLEKERIPSLDRPADAFARLLVHAAPPTGDPVRDRAMEQLLYHVGRWIYLIDAWDDLSEDLVTGSYNPFVARYGLKAVPEPESELVQEADLTLKQSLSLAWTAFQLLDLGEDEALVENILSGGLPLVQKLVFHGQWKAKRKKLWENYDERSL